MEGLVRMESDLSLASVLVDFQGDYAIGSHLFAVVQEIHCVSPLFKRPSGKTRRKAFLMET